MPRKHIFKEFKTPAAVINNKTFNIYLYCHRLLVNDIQYLAFINIFFYQSHWFMWITSWLCAQRWGSVNYVGSSLLNCIDSVSDLIHDVQLGELLSATILNWHNLWNQYTDRSQVLLVPSVYHGHSQWHPIP